MPFLISIDFGSQKAVVNRRKVGCFDCLAHTACCLLLTKLTFNQFDQFRDSLFRVIPFGNNAKGRAFGGSQDDHMHDTFPIGFDGFFTTFIYSDLRRKLVGHIDELHGRACMQPKSVANRRFARSGWHGG